MEYIRLSKDERQILKLLSKHGQRSLDTMPRSRTRRALRSLESRYFVRVAWIEGGDFEAVALTGDARDYLIENPRLRNPIDWRWVLTAVTAVVAALGALAGFIALFISCTIRVFEI